MTDAPKSNAAEAGLQWVPRAAAIAREAGGHLREFFAQGVETEYKGDVDLVTVADRTAEKLIRERLAEAFPEHGGYGEEGTRERMDGEFSLVCMDPLDGTTNLRTASRSSACRWGWSSGRRGGMMKMVKLSWPACDPTTRCAMSLTRPSADAGRWLNGKPMHVSKPMHAFVRHGPLAISPSR